MCIGCPPFQRSCVRVVILCAVHLLLLRRRFPQPCQDMPQYPTHLWLHLLRWLSRSQHSRHVQRKHTFCKFHRVATEQRLAGWWRTGRWGARRSRTPGWRSRGMMTSGVRTSARFGPGARCICTCPLLMLPRAAANALASTAGALADGAAAADDVAGCRGGHWMLLLYLIPP